MFKKSVLPVWMLIALIAACRTESEERTIKGTEYFPVRVGDVRTFRMDTIHYDLFLKSIDTVSRIIREEVVEVFVDGMQDTVYRVELSTYNPQKFEWIVFKSFERKIQGNYALEKLENRTEVKMLFPVAQYKTKGNNYTWNLNMFNDREPQQVKYTSVSTPYNNGLNPYNDCITIKLSKPQTGIINNIREEVYARNIGLIYRFTDSTDYLQSDSFPSGIKTIIRLQN